MAAPLTDSVFEFKDIEFWIADVAPDRPGIETEYSDKSAVLNITYRVDWDLADQACLALMGNTTFREGEPQYGWLSRDLPHRFDGGPDWLWCKSARQIAEISRPMTDSPRPGAEHAIIKARYEPRLYRLLEDDDMLVGAYPDEASTGGDPVVFRRYVTRMPPRSKDRTLQTKGGGWKFVDRTRAIPTPIPIVVNEQELVYVWHHVPIENIPLAAILDLYGKSNSTVFDGRAIGTVVFADYSFEPMPTFPDGRLGVDVHYTMIWKLRGANKFPDPDRGHRYFEVVAVDGSGNKPHPPGDFKALFRPTAAP